MAKTRPGKGRAVLKFIIGLLIAFIVCAGFYLFVKEYDRRTGGKPQDTAPVSDPTPLTDPYADADATQEPASEPEESVDAAESEPETAQEPAEATDPAPETDGEAGPEETADTGTAPEAEESAAEDLPEAGEEPAEETAAEPSEPADEEPTEPAEDEPAEETADEPAEDVPTEAEEETAPEAEPADGEALGGEPTDAAAQETGPEAEPTPGRTLSEMMGGMSVPEATQGAASGMIDFKVSADTVSVTAFLSTQEPVSENAQYFIVFQLANGDAAYVFDTWPVENDTGLDIDLACFSGAIAAGSLPDGWYRTGLMVVDGETSRYVPVDDDSYSFIANGGQFVRFAE